MLTLTERLPPAATANAQHTLTLTAEERTRSRHRFSATDGTAVQLLLPRGTVLRDGDLLRAAEGAVLVRVAARPEPVLTVRAPDARALARAAYHLGNRHVALELGRDYLRLSPDPVLVDMLRGLGLTLTEETAAFHPEAGAYGAHQHGAPFLAGHRHV
jgi:urease accessory protein